ncbi:exodeoxyribonuclease V subunit alpha [Chromobacterium subtsugae]|uniref:RecBCD enzyme subunit RecD n=2 Tax=Chromobacterium subtsugae TaxID=251747 RepID=A0ABS7FFP4_9NEIS|nr:MULTISPECIES: exodeoxyribonuclease V subunit alpha [Chromobacterium]KZE86406.1 exodeoxyribonuclease V subunit alpha [Chromobacterium sp. F49]MBW7567664.1 exodeoxyribonuclease V subunit alpha [Chromobacterium subtsugae]MBW8288890.1 exodeoxyribonuclease V subunit alpha [Chromobacterium subtsugae]WSE91317.1 exodeoxyribonuclease V subunit alpha [Chromobacterium subtsugae]WVH59692.1 exodeoxyribonuclease V subunit alpha [Chromobacterium subtsugae]
MNSPISLLPDQLSSLFLRLFPDADDAVLALVRELSAANQAGHVCLPLAHRAERKALQRSQLVGRPGDYAPLILDDAGRLYFARHWHDEDILARDLARLAEPLPPPDESALAALLARLFPGGDAGPDRQKLAAALAARQRLMVISGGPGTGKTTTVVRLLALLAALSPRPLVMAMAAPTGKAAARLSESVRGARDRLDVDEAVRRQLPAQAETLHRLLGLRPGAEAPRHHAGNPLPLDVLVVDEASMIDLALMARAVAALPSQARLILLGDRDQLSSVEAGAVLGELCGRIAYREETRQWLRRVCGDSLPDDGAEGGRLTDCVALLTHSHRFGADSGIGELARLVNAGDGRGSLDLLQVGGHPDIGLQPAVAAAALLDKRRGYLQAATAGAEPDAVQRAFSAFMLLAAERRQVADCNRELERQLELAGLKQPGRDWYAGRPVMIGENDYGLGLFNGDIGFALPRAQGLRVVFPAGDGGWREFAPGRLPAHDTVFAMTVHKSQGSEYDEVWLQLPSQPGALLNRALLYTAITRARQRFAAAGSGEVWLRGVELAPQRHSGLADRLR